MTLDLYLLQPDRIQLLIGKRAAVEQEPNASRPIRLGPKKVNANQPAPSDLETALLPCLALACLPRRLSASVNLAAGNPVVRLFFDATPQSPLDDFVREAPNHRVVRLIVD